jgi:AcrR family transcriptional regulator
MLTKRGEATRRRLLEAAREELIACGGEFEFAAVAQRADVSAGLPYRYFESKSALCVALVDDFFHQWEAVAHRPILDELSDDWWIREQARIEKTVDFFYDHPLGSLVVTRLAGDAQVVGAVRERLTQQVHAATTNVARGQQLGRVPDFIDAELCGALLMGGVHQALATALSSQPAMERARVVWTLQDFMRRVLCIQG